jgi:hypothetical protein
MKSSSGDEVKNTFQEVVGKTKKELRKLNDPTLQGKDENKVGRVQRKAGQACERPRKVIMPAVK